MPVPSQAALHGMRLLLLVLRVHRPVLGSLEPESSLVGEERPESAFEGLGLNATSSPGSCLLSGLTRRGIPDFPIKLRPIRPARGPRFPFPAESGNGDSLPVSRPTGNLNLNRESGERELVISGCAHAGTARLSEGAKCWQWQEPSGQGPPAHVMNMSVVRTSPVLQAASRRHAAHRRLFCSACLVKSSTSMPSSSLHIYTATDSDRG